MSRKILILESFVIVRPELVTLPRLVIHSLLEEIS